MRPRQHGSLDAALLVLVSACGGERDRLLSQLQSGRPEERAAAVKRLADSGNSMDVVLIRRAATDPAAIVRAEVAAGLGRRREHSSADVLAELLEDPDESVQAKAAAGLAALGGKKVRAQLSARYARAGRATRWAIVQALRSAEVPHPMEAMVSAEAAALWNRNLKTLEEGSAPERAAAAQELGRSGRGQAVARLLALAQQSSPLVASAAVRGLAEAADPSAAAPLAKLLVENEPDLRAAVCDALGHLGHLDSAPLLEAIAIEGSSASAFATAALIALPQQDATDRRLCEVVQRAAPAQAVAAAKEMRYRGGCAIGPLIQTVAAARPKRASRPAAAPPRRPLPTPPALEVALQVLAALGPTAQAAQPQIAPLLEDPDSVVRIAALTAAAELRANSLVLEVANAYDEQLVGVGALRAKWIAGPLPREYAPGFGPGQTNASSGEKDRLAELTARVRARNSAEERSAAAPLELADDTPPEELRLFASALRALGMVGAPEALTAAKAFSADSSALVRAAAYAAAAYAGESGIALAQQGLADPQPEVRSTTAKALVEQGAPGANAVLAQLDRRRGAALELLEALQRAPLGESAAERLAPFLWSGAAEGALAAALLGKSRARGAAAELIKYLDDPVAAGRRQAVVALGEIGDPRAGEAIARQLYDESPDVRAVAIEALARLGNTSEIEVLEALKSDYYVKVRRAAHGALDKLRSVSEVR